MSEEFNDTQMLISDYINACEKEKSIRENLKTARQKRLNLYHKIWRKKEPWLLKLAGKIKKRPTKYWLNKPFVGDEDYDVMIEEDEK